MRIVFMGTPDFAAAPLETIIKSGKHQVTGVITQPDKPKGRGKSMQLPPGKEKALEYDIPVWQTVQVNSFSPGVSSVASVMTFPSSKVQSSVLV